MAQQTAVVWLVTKLSLDILGEIPLHKWDEIREAVEQAKQMEKEQHSNTWTDAITHHKGDDYIGKEISFEQYYNETYKNK